MLYWNYLTCVSVSNQLQQWTNFCTNFSPKKWGGSGNSSKKSGGTRTPFPRVPPTTPLTLLKDEEVHIWDNHALACNFAKYSPISDFFFTHRLSSKPFSIWLLTTPPHLKYVATLPCNLSLMACFADVNVSQGSVATYARCGRIFNIRLTTNLPRNLAVKYSLNRLTYDRMVVMSLWLCFFGPPCRFRLRCWPVWAEIRAPFPLSLA